MRSGGERRKARSAAKSPRPAAKLRRQVERLTDELRQRTAERDEALAQQAASTEVLQLINASPGALAPVFDAILYKAMHLCGSAFGALGTWRGERFAIVATRGGEPLARYLATNETWLGPRAGFARVAKGDGYLQFADIARSKFYRSGDPHSRAIVDLGGARTTLTVPLVKEDEVLGLLLFYRQEVRPFSEREIALVKSFAAQAVIAIENARLLEEINSRNRELEHSLERQTATSEILRAIAASPGAAEGTLRKIAETTARLFGAVGVSFRMVEGNEFKLSVGVGRGAEQVSAALWNAPATRPSLRGRNLPAAVVRENRQIHLRDLDNLDPEMADWSGPPVARTAGIRTMVGTPLRSGGRAFGAMTVYRDELRPFDEVELQLLQSFADQAVIAIENTRLLTEQREALEQQTATAEVLQVINSSPGDLTPVFDAILEKAHNLCGATRGALQLYDGDKFRAVAVRGQSEAFAALLRQGYSPGANNPERPLLEGARFAQVADLAEVDDPMARAAAELSGTRTALFIPLRKDGSLLGKITASRHEVKLFTEREITLLENFAAQAVIAMENARLITETRTALEQQTATAEVLQVINASPGDLAPVFDAMLEKAMRLCAAAFGLMLTHDGTRFHRAAQRGVPAAYSEFHAKHALTWGAGTGPARVLQEKRVVQVVDAMESDAYRSGDPLRRAIVDIAGARTLLSVPLLKDDIVRGILTVYRQEVRPFSGKQIALLQNFAAQAVIAMENARLITETREALEQQTATAEVLQVINSAPGELAPVFDAMLEKATRVCGADAGVLCTYDGQRFWPMAARGFDGFPRDPITPHPEMGIGRVARGEDIVHILDSAKGTVYESGNLDRRHIVELGGARTQVTAALRKEGVLRGSFTLWRREVRPFTDKQVALLQSFAAQAVIAMENARLITETREALEQQTATAEILQVINSSPGELAPVFDVILEKAHRLCGVANGNLVTRDGEYFHTVATRGVGERSVPLLRRPFRAPPNSPYARLIAGERVVHVHDATVEAAWDRDDPRRVSAIDIGLRTMLFVPLRKEGALLGYISANRHEVRPYSDKEIALLESLAAQAVIAVENARLLGELRQRQAELARSVDELTATGDVLKIISRSSTDLETVLDTLVETVARLCRADHSYMFRRRDDKYHLVTARGLSPEAKQFIDTHPFVPDRGSLSGRVELERRAVHIPDASQDTEYTHPAQKLVGYRTMLGIPLLREDALIGIFIVSRTHVEPFTNKEIELATSFADQAVIAIENARLFEELRERQAELRVTFDNMGDGVAMFDADRRLAAWNRNLQEMLDLPQTFLAERPSYAALFGYLAHRGEFGSVDLEAELRRNLEDTSREIRYERTRPDGRVIEVRRNPVPGGGFVLIYTDITERKRAEEAVRSARDAAESALAELQTAQASLLHAQKMAALGQLTAGIAHEIKNPLNFVNNFASLSRELLDELKEAAAPAMAALDVKKRADFDETIDMLNSNLKKIIEHGRRADGIVKSMLAHSRGGSGDRQVVELNALVEESLNLAYHGARAQDQSFNITLERDFDAAMAPIELVPQDVTRVFLNLFGNGFYAAHKRARSSADGFRPVLRVATRDSGDAVEIRVRDNGIGIPAEARDKLFQPFFTTKPTGEGTGLGLSISYDIVTQQHGGSISVESEAGVFTEFTVRLPRRSRPVPTRTLT